MSRLRVYYGDGASTATTVAEADEPQILSFQRYTADRPNPRRFDPLLRARQLRENDCCPHCRRGTVEPLELADGLRSRNNLPIPGTATLVGFHCLSCHWEWPA